MPDRAAGSSSSDQEKVTLFEGKSGSRWQWKKQPQLLYMLDRIAAILSNDPTFTNNPNRKYRILDIGGGKGLLAMAIAKVSLLT
jgi:2-polyprenyl-3-methyl-5-hydroxy-6-metoxy-1,4-benzoquinol methylase